MTDIFLCSSQWQCCTKRTIFSLLLQRGQDLRILHFFLFSPVPSISLRNPAVHIGSAYRCLSLLHKRHGNALSTKLPVTRRYTSNTTRWIVVFVQTSGKTAPHIPLMCLTGCKSIWLDGSHATVSIIAGLRKANKACLHRCRLRPGQTLDDQSFCLPGYMIYIRWFCSIAIAPTCLYSWWPDASASMWGPGRYSLLLWTPFPRSGVVIFQTIKMHNTFLEWLTSTGRPSSQGVSVATPLIQKVLCISTATLWQSSACGR